MKFNKVLVASAAVLAVVGAHAQVTGTAGGGYGSFLSLSAAGLSDGVNTIATVSGTVLSATEPGSIAPEGTVGNFLSAGPTAGTTASLDFGTGYDCFSTRSHTDNPAIVGAARANRAMLVAVMARHGFKNYEKEWWHFTLEPEMFPKTYFDFPIRPRRRATTGRLRSSATTMPWPTSPGSIAMAAGCRKTSTRRSPGISGRPMRAIPMRPTIGA